MRESRPALRAVVVWLALGVGALVHLTPGLALVFPGRLRDLYGVTGMTTSELLLLQHRALLLALLGAALLAALARPELRVPALLAALVSNVVFIGLVLGSDVSAQIARVALVDGVVLPLVVVGLALTVRRPAPLPERVVSP